MSDMTMRDQFAMAALTGIIASDSTDKAITALSVREGQSAVFLTSTYAYELADAMMKARQAQGEGK